VERAVSLSRASFQSGKERGAMSWHRRKKTEDPVTYPSVIEGIKSIYARKVRPLEEMYQFEYFHQPLLRDSDFDANPMVLLLGQYSTGKTTFIKYLLEEKFPGAHIGPEPTTDRFMAVFHGQKEMVTPGNALCVQAGNSFALSLFRSFLCFPPVSQGGFLLFSPVSVSVFLRCSLGGSLFF
jgi:N-terminal EH-domain containing protein/Dynamin family